MSRRTEVEIRPKTVQISFGTIFTVRSFGKETNREDCFIDIGEDNYFYAGQLTKSKRGKPKLVHTATGSPEVFGRLVGLMSTEDVIEAFREGARDGWIFTDVMEGYVRQSAQKGSRMLLLNRD